MLSPTPTGLAVTSYFPAVAWPHELSCTAVIFVAKAGGEANPIAVPIPSKAAAEMRGIIVPRQSVRQQAGAISSLPTSGKKSIGLQNDFTKPQPWRMEPVQNSPPIPSKIPMPPRAFDSRSHCLPCAAWSSCEEIALRSASSFSSWVAQHCRRQFLLLKPLKRSINTDKGGGIPSRRARWSLQIGTPKVWLPCLITASMIMDSNAPGSS